MKKITKKQKQIKALAAAWDKLIAEGALLVPHRR